MIKSILLLLFSLTLITAFPKSRKLNENTKRNLEESAIDITGTWEPIRIKFEYVTDADDETKEFLDKIFSISGTFLSKYLLVRRYSDKIKLPKDAPTLFESFLEISSDLLSVEYEADLVIYFISIFIGLFCEYDE